MFLQFSLRSREVEESREKGREKSNLQFFWASRAPFEKRVVADLFSTSEKDSTSRSY
jgi:hypothetical protein